MSTDLRRNALTRVSSTSVDLNQAADTEVSLFTVPTGEVFYPVMVVVRNPSAGLSNSVVTFGKTGGTCDEFLGDQTLTNIAATDDYVICQPVPNATPAIGSELTAAQVFGVEITTDEGSAATVTMDVYGYLVSA